MARCTVENADKILDVTFPVLDLGFVRLVDYMGGDERIVQAARVSYGAGTKTKREDVALIDYLLRNAHTSPFEQVVLTFHCKMPIFIARQWVRHRTARINEISGRYSIMQDEFYMPDLSAIAMQSKDNKQGRGEVFSTEDAKQVQQKLQEMYNTSYQTYLDMIEKGTAKEIARIALPVSLYTQWYWQIDLNNLFHFLKLRLHSHAQYEIRVYAEKMLHIAEQVAPYAVTSFKNHILGSSHINKQEGDILRQLLDKHGIDTNLSEDELRRLKDKLNT
jgi:thymidylate synthase (FAD)